MRPRVQVVLAAVDASADQVSAAIPGDFAAAISVQGVSTGSSTGTLKLQASNDGVNWVDIPNATVSVTAASIVLVPTTNLAYHQIRVAYAKNNGLAGTITATIAGWGF